MFAELYDREVVVPVTPLSEEHRDFAGGGTRKWGGAQGELREQLSSLRATLLSPSSLFHFPTCRRVL